MTTSQIFDSAALDMLLNNDRRGLARLATQARRAFGQECPHCGTREEHDSNADGSTFCCVSCGELFDAE